MRVIFRHHIGQSGILGMNSISAKQSRNNLLTALLAGSIAVGMVGLGFAAVPLYRIFCEVTGYGGTTMRISEAKAATYQATTRTMSIRFDANHRSDLPWDFKPERPTDNVTVGSRDMAIFLAKNLSDMPVTGTANFNVSPQLAGKYFNKVQCFCFTEQTLKPGQQMRMPVIYYVDPKILTDPDTKDIQEITLSYTFNPVDQTPEAS
jgi:cytochrome c oxidase assembly protein subunit 11